MSIPVVGGSHPVVVPGLATITTVPPTRLNMINIYNSFDVETSQQSPTNLAPIIVLALNQSVPPNTTPGTLILRLAG